MIENPADGLGVALAVIQDETDKQKREETGEPDEQSSEAKKRVRKIVKKIVTVRLKTVNKMITVLLTDYCIL